MTRNAASVMGPTGWHRVCCDSRMVFIRTLWKKGVKIMEGITETLNLVGRSRMNQSIET